MVERPVDILHHIGCLKNRAKQSAHHFLRRCIRSSEEGPCLKVTPFKTVMTVLNGVPVLRAAVFCAPSGISADDVRAKRPDGDRKQVGEPRDEDFVAKGWQHDPVCGPISVFSKFDVYIWYTAPLPVETR